VAGPFDLAQARLELVERGKLRGVESVDAPSDERISF
jgi:hypothetical protein